MLHSCAHSTIKLLFNNSYKGSHAKKLIFLPISVNMINENRVLPIIINKAQWKSWQSSFEKFHDWWLKNYLMHESCTFMDNYFLSCRRFLAKLIKFFLHILCCNEFSNYDERHRLYFMSTTAKRWKLLNSAIKSCCRHCLCYF